MSIRRADNCGNGERISYSTEEVYRPRTPLAHDYLETNGAQRKNSRFDRQTVVPLLRPGHRGRYLDKNYGGILIVWDRLFGTFEKEVRRVRYGLTKNIDTYNPVSIGFLEFGDIIRDVRSARTTRERVRYMLGHPGWRSAD